MLLRDPDGRVPQEYRDDLDRHAAAEKFDGERIAEAMGMRLFDASE